MLLMKLFYLLTVMLTGTLKLCMIDNYWHFPGSVTKIILNAKHFIAPYAFPYKSSFSLPSLLVGVLFNIIKLNRFYE